jgi:aryl-alcohol dehydrogenase-like predicted oxidoreductase
MVSDIPPGTDIALNELAYNLISRAIEFETLPFCQENGVGVLGYIGLMQGILTGKYETISKIPPLLRRTRHFDASGNPKIRHGEKGFETETQKALDDIRSLAGRSGCTMTDLAVGWVLSNKTVASSLMGARTKDQLTEVVRSAENRLDDETLRELDSITADLKFKMGNCFDYWESRENDRTV